MSTATTQYAAPGLEEHFTYYALHFDLPVQTDTPDLLGAFQKVQDRAALALAARAQAEEDAQLAEADMAVGFETLDD